MSQGMNHFEGGWPKDINPSENDQTMRFRKKIEKDDAYISSVLNLCQVGLFWLVSFWNEKLGLNIFYLSLWNNVSVKTMPSIFMKTTLRQLTMQPSVKNQRQKPFMCSGTQQPVISRDQLVQFHGKYSFGRSKTISCIDWQ